VNLEDWLGMSILPSLTKANRQRTWALLSYYIHAGGIIKLTLIVSYEPYCYHCYRRESQLEDGAKLNACQYCLLTSFCPSCQQTHPSAECATLQDVVADDKIMVDLRRRTGKSSTVSFTKLPRKQHFPLSSAKDWYDYYTRLSDMGGFRSKMNRDLKYLSNDPKEREFVEYIRCGTDNNSTHLNRCLGGDNT
jgi:mitochondrial splicing suppressor protein 51